MSQLQPLVSILIPSYNSSRFLRETVESALAQVWDDVPGRVPELSLRLAVIADYAREISALGPANFIYADGDALFVHADRRTQPDGAMRAPGLYLLQRYCWRTAPELHDAGVNLTSIRQDVALVATVPLTDELWEPLGEGDLIALRDGLCFGADGVQVEPEQVAGRKPLPVAARQSLAG